MDAQANWLLNKLFSDSWFSLLGHRFGRRRSERKRIGLQRRGGRIRRLESRHPAAEVRGWRVSISRTLCLGWQMVTVVLWQCHFSLQNCFFLPNGVTYQNILISFSSALLASKKIRYNPSVKHTYRVQSYQKSMIK